MCKIASLIFGSGASRKKQLRELKRGLTRSLAAQTGF